MVKILIPENGRFPAGDLSLNTVCTALSQLLDNGGECAVRSFSNLRKNFGEFSSEQGARVTATYLTFVETCKLMAKAPLDFFRRFFDMIVAGRRDYALMKEAFLVKPVKNRKLQFLKILYIPSKHKGWCCIAIRIGCLLM